VRANEDIVRTVTIHVPSHTHGLPSLVSHICTIDDDAHGAVEGG